MLNLEREKENFKEHVATFTDYGNIKILDFKKPNSSYYRIRFMFEEDYCRLHISGDLGGLIATNYNNMTWDGFSDFLDNRGYFEEKIDCHERAIYYYDYDKAKKDLEDKLDWWEPVPDFDFETPEEIKAEKIEDILEDFYEVTGIGSAGYATLSEIDPDCFEYISYVGREETGILELYMLAFKLATKQLREGN